MILLESVTAAFLVGFPAIFSIVNPVGNALTFLNMTADRTHRERVVLARRVGLYSLTVLLGSIWFGAYVLAFFGISIGALRIAGGLAVAVQAWTMLMAPDQILAPKSQNGKTASGPRQDVAFFPLTMPFTAGPGSIAVAIALGAESGSENGRQIWAFGGTTLAALAIAALVWIIYASADRLSLLLGVSGERVLGRLVAFLLLCIGVQMLWTGIEGLLSPWLSKPLAR
jgi:multiple antibiotic resistance protein